MITNDSYHSNTKFTNLENERVIGLDVYRIIACMLVVINHCNSKVMFQVEPQSLAWYVTVGAFYITKVAVPGFFMIAGYNLLHKEDSWEKAWSRVGRIFAALIIFSVLYYVWKVCRGVIVVEGATGFFLALAHLKNMVSMIITHPITDAYWYLYAYLGLMIMLPFLQRLVARVTDQDMRIFFGLAFVFACVLPTIGEFFPAVRIARDFNLPLVGGSVVYMLIGHCVYLNFDRRDVFLEELKPNIRRFFFDTKGVRPWILLLGITLGFVINMIVSAWEYTATLGETYLSIGEIEYFPLALESICLFVLLLQIDYCRWIRAVVTVVAPTTFGIYLLTDFLCAETNMVYFWLCPHMNRIFAVAIEDIVVIIAGFMIVNTLRLIPVVRKVL